MSDQVQRSYDRRGVPIYPGDLLKTDHFIGARRKRYFLYHTVVQAACGLEMVPTHHLEPTMVSSGGRCRLAAIDTERSAEVIAGYGPGDLLSFEDRPREKHPRKRDCLADSCLAPNCTEGDHPDDCAEYDR